MTNLRMWLRGMHKAPGSHPQWCEQTHHAMLYPLLSGSHRRKACGRPELCPLLSATLNGWQLHFLFPHFLPDKMRGNISLFMFFLKRPKISSIHRWWLLVTKCPEMLRWAHSLVIRQMSQKLIAHHRRNFRTFRKYGKNVPSQGWNVALSSSSLWPAQA